MTKKPTTSTTIAPEIEEAEGRRAAVDGNEDDTIGQRRIRSGITEYKVTDTKGNTVVKSVSWGTSSSETTARVNEGDKGGGVLGSKYRPREKVPVQQGFSMLHWYQRVQRESRTGRGSGGGGGRSGYRKIKMSEVRQHRTKDSAWTVLRGKVYDITPYLQYHPGGVDKLMMGAGRDMTSLFDKYHSWVNIDFILGTTCYLGDLDEDQ